MRFDRPRRLFTQRISHRGIRRNMGDQHPQPPHRQRDYPRVVAAVAVADVDAVELLKVGLHRRVMLTEQTEEASYSPAVSKPYASAMASMRRPRSRTFIFEPFALAQSRRACS